MADLGDKLDDIEGLADKRLSIFGLRFTPTQLGAAFAILSTVIGGLYGAFLMYQRVEEVASLDIGSFEQRMELINQKIDNQEKLLSSIEGNLRDTKQLTYDIEKRVNDRVVYFEGKLAKNEVKLEYEIKKIEDKLQKALDNPLAN